MSTYELIECFFVVLEIQISSVKNAFIWKWDKENIVHHCLQGFFSPLRQIANFIPKKSLVFWSYPQRNCHSGIVIRIEAPFEQTTSLLLKPGSINTNVDCTALQVRIANISWAVFAWSHIASYCKLAMLWLLVYHALFLALIFLRYDYIWLEYTLIHPSNGAIKKTQTYC